MISPADKQEREPIARRGAIYRIRHTGGDTLYIGSALQPSKRQEEHFRLLLEGKHHSGHLQHAFNKYGREAFVFEIVEWVEDHLFLTAREQFWMWRHAGRLYNMSPTAGSNAGIIFYDATRAKQALRMRGNSWRTGKPHPTEDKAKISTGLRRAYREGRRTPTDIRVCTKNLAAYNAEIAAGTRAMSWTKPERNAALLVYHRQTRSLKQTADAFGICTQSAHEIIQKYNPSQLRKWTRKQ